MKQKKIVHLIMVFVVCFSVLGCGGSSSRTYNTNTTTTMGQELQDLDKAKKSGLITEKEYNRARKQILERYQ